MAKCDGFAKACMQFKPGDVVYLYMPGIDESFRYTAKVIEVVERKGLRLEFAEREGMNLLYFHPRQCRKPQSDEAVSAQLRDAP